ncbi:DUF4367 domain-containing protein [Anaerocolumna cellulosilytica]|nr:DUF4367 domain-containing protein [Anaerocolumna cellulosilytica]
MNTIDISDDFLRRFVPDAEVIRLNKLPDDRVLNHKFSKSFDRKMRKLIRKNSVNYLVFMKMLRKIAILLIIVLSMAFTTIMSVEALRNHFFCMLYKIYSDFTSVTFITENTGQDFDLIYSIPQLPNGYTKVQSTQTNSSFSAVYTNGENKLFFEQSYITNNQMILDTEDTLLLQTKSIKGIELHYFTNKELSQVYWSQDEYFFSLVSDLNIHMLLELSEQIISEGYNNK